MKYLLVAIIILVLVIGYVEASGPAPKVNCGICKKVFTEGEDKIERMIKGRFQDIHIDHRIDEENLKKAKLAQSKWQK